MKTAIEELLDELRLDMKSYTLCKEQSKDEDYLKWVDAVMWGINNAITKAKSLLSAEQKAIEDAFDAGAHISKSSFAGFLTPDGESYFKTTYKP